MAVDPHEVRMAAAQGAMGTLNALDDDDTVALFEPVCESLYALNQALKSHNLPPASITQILVGLAVGVVLHAD